MFARAAPSLPSSLLEYCELDSICFGALQQTWYQKRAIAQVCLETPRAADYCKGWRFLDLQSECFATALVDRKQVIFEGFASGFIIQRSMHISSRFDSSSLCLAVASPAGY